MTSDRHIKVYVKRDIWSATFWKVSGPKVSVVTRCGVNDTYWERAVDYHSWKRDLEGVLLGDIIKHSVSIAGMGLKVQVCDSNRVHLTFQTVTDAKILCDEMGRSNIATRVR